MTMTSNQASAKAGDDVSNDRNILALHFHVRTNADQLAEQIFVAAFQVLNTIKLRSSFGDKRSHDVGQAGANVGHRHGNSMEWRGAVDDHRVLEVLIFKAAGQFAQTI